MHTLDLDDLRRQGNASATGILEVLPDGFGFLRDPSSSFAPGSRDIYVSPSQIRRFVLRTGDEVTGVVRPPKESEKYLALIKVQRINGRGPDAGRARTFEELTPLHPSQRLRLEHDVGALATRVVDLLAPLGRGARGLIFAPPRSGRTRLLQDLARGLAANHPDLHLIALLVDERPEEVTSWRRDAPCDVLASTFDESPQRHVQVADLVLERARRLVEQGEDVVLLMDSLTRLVRAHNHTCQASNRTLPGGLEPAALHRAKRFFGSARRTEEGGSLTLLATVLTHTEGVADATICEELSGTGNVELHLDANAATHRLFPALDPTRTATRHADLLLDEHEHARLELVRQAFQGDVVADLEWMLDWTRREETNAQVLDKLSTVRH